MYIILYINLKKNYLNKKPNTIFPQLRLSMMAGQDKLSYMVDEMLTRWYRLEEIPQRQVSRKDHPFSLQRMATFQQLNLKTEQCEALAL